MIEQFLIGFFLTFIGGFIAIPTILGMMQLFGLYTTVRERQCKVYVMFGKVLGVINEPGFHILITKLGIGALIVNLFGKCYELDMRLDQSSGITAATLGHDVVMVG